ncbi:GIP [Symbiodinium sp. CCMP2592]|nr:GIP [Symbiodinium sp. CCMP2592]
MTDLLTIHGYGLVLSALMAKYRPCLDVSCIMQRAKAESFANYVAAKEVARQEMEDGREQGQMWTFDQVVALLRPLDRLKLLAQAAGAELGAQASKRYPVLKMDEDPHIAEGEAESEHEYSEDEELDLAEGEYMFEDKEYTEDAPGKAEPQDPLRSPPLSAAAMVFRPHDVQPAHFFLCSLGKDLGRLYTLRAGSPRPAAEYADWLARAAAHALFDHQLAELAFQCDGGGQTGSPTLSDIDEMLDSPLVDADVSQQLPPLQLPEEGDEAVVQKELRDMDVSHDVSQVPESPARGSEVDIVDPPPELRHELYRLHRNLGPPELGTFCRALRNARVRSDRPICEKRKRPGPHRPAHLSGQVEFNSVIGVMVMIVISKNPEEVTRAVYQGWFKYFGPPHLTVVDHGTESSSRHFTDTLGEWGTVIHFTDALSPWQNSRTERAGASLKAVLGKILDEQVAISNEEFEQAVSKRTPYARMSDDVIDRDLVNHTHSDHTRKAQEMRTKAMKAWAEVQDETAIQRAVRTNVKTSDENEFADGDVVYVWRQTTVTNRLGWSGSRDQPDRRSLWVSLRGYLIKALREQVGLFPGCSEEQLILLHTEVYGLVSGPSWWRRPLLDVLLKLGNQLNPYERCVLTLPAQPKDCPKDLQKLAQINLKDLRPRPLPLRLLVLLPLLRKLPAPRKLVA